MPSAESVKIFFNAGTSLNLPIFFKNASAKIRVIARRI